MGIYLNPDNDRYQMMLNTDTFVDKSMLIKYTNDLFATEKRFICVSRPRRFGKSVNLNMLSAYSITVKAAIREKCSGHLN